MCPAQKLDGTLYYEYMLCYVNDVLIISMDPDGIADELKEHFVLKEVLNPAIKRERYLGAQSESLPSLMALTVGTCRPRNT